MKDLRNMKELIYLDMEFGRTDVPSLSHLNYNDEDSLYLPNSLRYLRWNGYPFKCLPKSFQAPNLVGLEMRLGLMNHIWEEGERKVELWLILCICMIYKFI